MDEANLDSMAKAIQIRNINSFFEREGGRLVSLRELRSLTNSDLQELSLMATNEKIVTTVTV